MKKFFAALYLFIMALAVFTMSGCGGGGGGSVSVNNPVTQQSAQSRRMVVSSPAFKRDGSYSLFRGNLVGVRGTNAKYYVAPVTRGTETITMNLEFANSVSEDLPFVITEASDESKVIFSYNPSGTGKDTTTESVTRYGGGTQKLKYTNLGLSASSVELDDSDAIEIILDGTSATASGEKVPEYDYVWHADPQHPAQYWTLGANGTEELDEDAYEAAIEAAGTNNGLYIARDIRYISNTLDFSTSRTAKKDEDTEYVVYYDTSAADVKSAIVALGEKYGTAYSSDNYIFATLPMSVGGMGGMPTPGTDGGMPSGDMTPPDGNMPSGDMTPPSGNMPSGDMPAPGGNPPGSSDTRLPVMRSMRAADSTASNIASFSTMTHSSADAYANPVLHITEPGTYKISGTWSGQIWVEAGAKAKHQVALILNGVTVECTAGPALVFYKVYTWAEDNGYDSQSVLASDDLWKNIGDKMLSSDGYYDVGAIVEIADGTTNTFIGSNLYRILELCPKIDDDTYLPKYTGSGIGTDISEQEKMYKLDSAFHSRRSMVIGGGSEGTGTLNITSTTYEGLDSEMHMLVNGGNISVTAPDDGINVNEDYVSIFQMDDGTLTISSTGGDGIDSNGWVSLNGGTVNISAGNQAQNAAGEAGIDAENDVYISDSVTYNYTSANGSGGGDQNPSGGDTSAPDQSQDNSNANSDSNSNSNSNTNTDSNTNTNTGTNTNTNTNTETNTNINTNTETETNTNTETETNTETDTGTTTLPVTETTTPVGDSVFTLFPNESTIQTDTEGARNIPATGSTFPLVHRVNDFGGMTTN